MEPYLNLGRLCEGEGELARAAAYLETGIQRHPGHPMLMHLLAAVKKEAPGRVPREHVIAFFDEFARNFDAQLARTGYSLPQIMATLIGPRLEEGARILDLGCGTGLVAKAFGSRRLDTVGVDLSPRMLELAQQRGGYTRLVLQDLDEFLTGSRPREYRAVLAADVFIYVGALSRTFREVARVLSPGGLFLFSVELIEGEGYHLHPSGRFGHSLDYVRSLAAEHGMIEIAAFPVALDRQGSLDAYVMLLERLDDDEHDDGEEEHGR
jgi:predicted TPR repeat methyltransferase